MRIYPIFLPFYGCPSRCVYCDQRVNTLEKPPDSKSILKELRERIDVLKEEVLKSKSPGEIAFYGGTFTALPPETLLDIVDMLKPLIKEGLFTGLRCSTRPDAVTIEKLEILKAIPVTMIELGVQTLDDHILNVIRRGYTVRAVEDAVKLVKSFGWKVGLQLMVGLPYETRELFLETVRKAISLAPDGLRFYPLLVFPGTVLEGWYRAGRFKPLSLKEAILWCAEALVMCEDAGVPVMRMGLQANSALDGGAVLAGPYHPAFGYFVRVHWWRLVVDRELSQLGVKSGARVSISVPHRFLYECRGPRDINRRFWMKKRKLGEISIEPLLVMGESGGRCFRVDWSYRTD